MADDLFAAIEAGGTKIICAVAASDGGVLAQTRIATGAPEDTFAVIARFYRDQIAAFGPITAGGIGSFGPLDLDPGSPDYGALAGTPKPGWSSVNMLRRFSGIIAAPAFIDTDVNCAAVAEARYGAARGLDRLCYMTVGTGIGVGIVEGGRTNAGTGHPEVGHIRIPRAPGDDFAGVCPSHGDCAEGLASGPAMKARWHTRAEDLPPDHVAWVYEAHYIAAICVNLTYTIRPQRIIVGGGVLERSGLLGAVRATFRQLVAGYALDRFSADAETFICAPLLVDPSPGLVGALELARHSVDPERSNAAAR